VCKAKGIAAIEFRGRQYPAVSLTEADLERELVKNETRYKSAFAFFSLPQFEKSDFATQGDPKNSSPYPMLKYSFAKSDEGRRNFTSYVKSYCFFTEPVESASELAEPLSQEIEARDVQGKIEIKYTVPTSPGLVSLKVRSTDPKKPYEYVFLDMARQRSGKFSLTTPPLEQNKSYMVEYQVGDVKTTRIVLVEPYTPPKKWFF
jgi:hypothetical protein